MVSLITDNKINSLLFLMIKQLFKKNAMDIIYFIIKR